MSEIEPEVSAVTKVARDLTEIENLACHLEAQAIHKANDRDMPGGVAMVALAHVASLEAWEHRLETTERLWWEDETAGHDERPDWLGLDESEEWEPPLQTLLFWSEDWRRIHGYELDRRATISSETGFIRWALNWAWDNETKWDDFARDIRKARVRLENALYAGRRVERVRVPCDNPECETKPRLIVVRGEAIDGSQDRHKCPACKKRYDEDDYRKAYAKQLRSQGAERYVPIVDAVATLRAQGRPERTIRKWLAECEAHAWCDPVTREQWVWWPDLWRLHLTTATRKRDERQSA